MKHVLRILSISIISTLLLSCGSNPPLATVEEVDLEKYQGVWYEIARLPIRQEEGLSCVQAAYRLNEDGTIEVVNHGYGEDGWESVEGTAIQPDPEIPGQLKVTFFWPFYGDYYIIELDDEYQYTLVGSPSREYLWILARTDSLDEPIIEQLSASAQAKGFDTSKFIFTEHGCPMEEE